MPARKLEWKRIKKDEGEGTPLLITPLIDIMFLLLIFFVMNTSFNKLSPLEINLPDSSASSSEVNLALTIILEKEERILLDEKEVPLEELAGEIFHIIETGNPDNVIIAGDESISYSFLVNVMDEVSKSGLSNITLITESR